MIQTHTLKDSGSTQMLLLRHADRDVIPDGDPGNEIPLLPCGIERALELGRSIGSNLVSIYTSPVLRCVETAEALVRGASVKLPIVHDRHLGDPGVYVIDGELAWESWKQIGHEQVVANIVNGNQLAGFADPREATRQLVRWMRDVCEGRHGIHVFVTHDSLVSAAAAHCLEHELAVYDWPDFLEWLYLEDNGDYVHAAYRGIVSRLIL